MTAPWWTQARAYALDANGNLIVMQGPITSILRLSVTP